jgi:hypothetical protein
MVKMQSSYKLTLPFLKLALLKHNVDFNPMVIGANKRDSCLVKRVKGDPAGGKRAPGAEINRQD